MKKFEIKGVERSCTNLVEYMLRSRYDVEVVGLDDKHEMFLTNGAISLVCVKHPLSWLLSIDQFGWVLPWMPFYEPDLPRNMIPATPLEWEERGECFQHYGEFYYLGWLKGSALVKFETLLSEGIDFLDQIMDQFGVKPANENVMLPTGIMGKRGNETCRRFDQAYYLNEEWRMELPQEVFCRAHNLIGGLSKGLLDYEIGGPR